MVPKSKLLKTSRIQQRESLYIRTTGEIQEELTYEECEED